MSKESPHIPPVQVSRPLTYSSGLWSTQDATQPVQLPPLQIPGPRNQDTSHVTRSSTSESPKDSTRPSSGRSGSASYSALNPPPISFARGDSGRLPFQPEIGHAQPQVPARASSSTLSHQPSRPPIIGEANLARSGATGALGPPAPLEELSGAARPERADSRGRGNPEPAIHGTQGFDLMSSGQLLPRLLIRQQPIAARACGFGERDRRLVDPPPILQLVHPNEPRDSASLLNMHLSTRYAVVQASLWDEWGQYDVTFAQPTNRKPGSRLMGTTFTTSMHAKDDTNRDGIFFAFSDLSCRTYGRFRLRFSLVMIDLSSGQVGSRVPVLDYALSEPFTVYSASDFPGMRPSTELTKALRESGCAIPVKKGRRSVFGTSLSEDEEIEGQGEAKTGSQVRPGKRRKG